MEFYTDVTAKVASIRDLTGEVANPETIPAVIEALDDAAALRVLELATEVGHVADRLRATAAGVISLRSSRERGHSGVAQSNGHRNAVALVQHITGGSRADAARQVRIGESLFETPQSGLDAGFGAGEAPDTETGHPGSRGSSGDALTLAGARSQPWHAPLRSAMLDGLLTMSQHDAIMRGLGQPPEPGTHHTEEEATEFVLAWSVAAEQLIDESSSVTVEELGRAARYVRDQLDPVGAEARFMRRYDARSFRFWTDRGGVNHGSLTFDDESAAWIRTVVDAALRPRRGGPRFVDPQEQKEAAQLIDDPRTNDQLAFDLMLDLLRAGTLAETETVFGARQAGLRLVQVVEDGEGADMPHPTGPAHTEDGLHSLPAWIAAQQACTTGIVPVTVDRTGNPLDVGRTHRLYTAKQRVALALRDGGCRWKHCDRPASYCEAHHIDGWSEKAGRTDIDRGILLCRFHHMQLHHGRWRITRDGLADFELHDPGGGSTSLRPRLSLKYAWAGIDPPTQRFRKAA